MSAMAGSPHGFLLAARPEAAGREVIVMGITGITRISAGLLAVGIRVRNGRTGVYLSD